MEIVNKGDNYRDSCIDAEDKLENLGNLFGDAEPTRP